MPAPYPSQNDVEAWAHQNNVSDWVVFDMAAMNQALPTDAPTALAFQQTVINLFQSFQTPSMSLGTAVNSIGSPPGTTPSLTSGLGLGTTSVGAYLDSTVTIQVLYAYISFYGSLPSTPSSLQGWAQGRGYLNNLNRQVQTPQSGIDYIGNQNSAANPGGAPAAPPAANPLDFASFFASLQSNPLGAIQTYPIAAGLSAVGAYFGAHKLKLIR